MQEVIRTHTQAHTDAHTCAVSVSVHYCYEYQARVNASGKWKHENGVIYNDLSPCVLLWVHTNAFNKPPWRNLITVCILVRLYLWDVLRRVTGRFCLKISRGHVRAEGGREEKKWWRKSLSPWMIYRGQRMEERKRRDWEKTKRHNSNDVRS